MKKLLIMSIALVAIMATVFTVSAFAANTVTIDSITLDRYGEDDTFNDAYANVTVNYTVTEGTVDRLTFYLAAQDLSSALEGEEAKVIYIDEQVNPGDGSITFVIEKKRIRTALTSANKIDAALETDDAYVAAENAVLTFKLGGTDIDTAASKTVVYVNPTMYGDANCNGKIQSNDATMILQVAGETRTLNVERTVGADANGNGRIQANDATAVLNYAGEKWTYADILSRHKYTLLEN